ncbi:MAG: hypothetical protein ACRD2R_00470 [Terriglobales bacterium]
MTQGAATSWTISLILFFAFSAFRPATAPLAGNGQESFVASPSAAQPADGAGALSDPHLLYVLSQMEMALGDVDSALQLAERAAKLEATAKQPAAKPEGSPCSSLQVTANRQIAAPEMHTNSHL